MLFLSILIILNMINSQSDETDILDVLEIKLFAAQLWWARFFKKKMFLWILHFGGGITVNFLRKENKVKVI